jgi:hypothetical protein
MVDPYPIALRDEHEPIQYAAEPMAEEGKKTEQPPQNEAVNAEDLNDPLYLQFKALVSNRQTALRPVAEELVELIRKQLSSPQPGFSKLFDSTKERFDAIEKETEEKAFGKFDEVLKENPDLPASRIVDLMQHAETESLFHLYLQRLAQQVTADSISEDMIEDKLKEIKESKGWTQLKELADKVNSWLQFAHVPNEVRLIALQNKARYIITQKLNEFILESKQDSNGIIFNDESQHALIDIMKASWIVDPDTRDFYLTEFQQRKKGTAGT